MKDYKVVIEVVFVRLGQRGLYGLFSTRRVSAINAPNAVQRAAREVNEDMRRMGGAPIATGLLATRVLVKDIWEVVSVPDVPQPVGEGATFYRIGPLASVFALVRLAYLRTRRSHLIIS